MKDQKMKKLMMILCVVLLNHNILFANGTDGFLYGTGWWEGSTNQLIRIDPTDGSGSFVGNSASWGLMNGLAYIPEPFTLSPFRMD